VSGFFLLTTSSSPSLGPTQPPIQFVPGDLSPGREADHLPPCGAAVKDACSYTSTPQYVFMAWCLVKHRGKFTFTFVVLSLSLLFRWVCGRGEGARKGHFRWRSHILIVQRLGLTDSYISGSTGLV
jgi:hypothetical protein